MLCYCFPLEAVLQGVTKKACPYQKTNRCRNSGNIEACVETHIRENVKFIVTNYKDRFKL